jgi:DNA helicase-2/ATP-dependent DNA helicase PcrA
MDHLFNGTIDRKYRHIVVDEAQDISPIDFKLLSLASINNWFTILGDTAQRLTPYRGIHRWRSLDRILGRSDITVQHARTSYRSNKHITRFSNRILRLFESTLLAPIPFDREGSRVEYHRHANVREMQQSVVEDIDRIRSEPKMSGSRIAILARDNMNLKKFEVYCQVLGRDDVVRIGQDRYVNSRTVLARIPDVRGLEYDAVIVLGVNDAFANTLFNQKLLYQATTRARHYLAIHWAGKISPILSEISDRGVRKIDRRRR